MLLLQALALAAPCTAPVQCERSCGEGDLDACVRVASLLDGDHQKLRAVHLATGPCEAGDRSACALLARLRIDREGSHHLWQTARQAPSPIDPDWVRSCTDGDPIGCSVVYEVTQHASSRRKVVAESVVRDGILRMAQEDPELCVLPVLHDRDVLEANPALARPFMEACRVAGNSAAWLSFIRDGNVDARDIDWEARGVGGTAFARAYDGGLGTHEWRDGEALRVAERPVWASDREVCSGDPESWSCAQAVARAVERARDGESLLGTARSKAQGFEQLAALCLDGVDAVCGLADRLERPTYLCEDSATCRAAAVLDAFTGDAGKLEHRCAEGDGAMCALMGSLASWSSSAVERWACAEEIDELCPHATNGVDFVDTLHACAEDPSSAACSTEARWAVQEGGTRVYRTARPLLVGCELGWSDGCATLVQYMLDGKIPGGASGAYRLLDARCEDGDWGSCSRTISRVADPDAERDRRLGQSMAACERDVTAGCDLAASLLRSKGETKAAGKAEKAGRKADELHCSAGDLDVCRTRFAKDARDRNRKAQQAHAWLLRADETLVSTCETGERCIEAVAWSLERERALCAGEATCVSAARGLREGLCEAGASMACGGPIDKEDREACAAGTLEGCHRLALGALARGQDVGIDALQRACSGGVTDACLLAESMGLRTKPPPVCPTEQACFNGCEEGDKAACDRATALWVGSSVRPARSLALRKHGCEAGHAPSCHALMADDRASKRLEGAIGLCNGGDAVGCVWAGQLSEREERLRWKARVNSLAGMACARGEEQACGTAAELGDAAAIEIVLRQVQERCAAGEVEACEKLPVESGGAIEVPGWDLGPDLPMQTDRFRSARVEVPPQQPPVAELARIVTTELDRCGRQAPACQNGTRAAYFLQALCQSTLETGCAESTAATQKVCTLGLAACDTDTLRSPGEGLHERCGNGEVEACRLHALLGETYWISGAVEASEQWLLRSIRRACDAEDPVACGLWSLRADGL